MKREHKKNIEKLEKAIEEKKKLPKEIIKKINAKAFKNVAIVAIIIIYFAVLYFGMTNIPTENYMFILKLIAIVLLIGTILIYEIGYRKDNEEVWLHGVEMMVIAFFSLYLTYLYSIFFANYGTLLLISGIICLIYYAIKIVIIQRAIEKEYNKSLIDIGEIVKKQ